MAVESSGSMSGEEGPSLRYHKGDPLPFDTLYCSFRAYSRFKSFEGFETGKAVSPEGITIIPDMYLADTQGATFLKGRFVQMVEFDFGDQEESSND